VVSVNRPSNDATSEWRGDVMVSGYWMEGQQKLLGMYMDGLIVVSCCVVLCCVVRRTSSEGRKLGCRVKRLVFGKWFLERQGARSWVTR